MLPTTRLTETEKKVQPSSNLILSPHSEKGSHTPALPLDRNQDAENKNNTKSIKFWLVIISVYLSFFLVALDRMIIGMYP